MRRAGIGHALYLAWRRICSKLNLKRIIVCGRLPGYYSYSENMSADLYTMLVVWGVFRNPVFSFQLKEGFNFCAKVSDYIP